MPLLIHFRPAVSVRPGTRIDVTLVLPSVISLLTVADDASAPLPSTRLFAPVVIESPACRPTAVLPVPVASSRASAPTAVLLPPVVAAFSAR